MTLWENVLAHYGWQGAALAAVLVVLLCVQLWYYLFAYGRIPGYKNSRRRQVLDAEPPLSVIVPMFSEDTLFVEERLPLMLAQEYSDFEVVIVYVGRDNDFFEDLLRIRQSFPRVTATKIEQDARFPISTKMALNVAQVELIEILARDDVDAGVPLGVERPERGELFALARREVGKIAENGVHVAVGVIGCRFRRSGGTCVRGRGGSAS